MANLDRSRRTEQPQPNPFEEAKGRFNKALLSGGDFDHSEIIPPLHEMDISVTVGIDAQDSVRLGSRYSVLALVNGQAAQLAERSGENTIADQLRGVAEGYRNMAELLTTPGSSDPLPDASGMKGAKTDRGGAQ